MKQHETNQAVQLEPIDLHITFSSAFRLSRLLSEMAEILSEVDDNGNSRQDDFEFCIDWQQILSLYAEVKLARMHVVNTNELATAINNEKGIATHSTLSQTAHFDPKGAHGGLGSRVGSEHDTLAETAKERGN